MDFLFGSQLELLITSTGLAGLFLIVFAESGLLIGFFLPGDSLLFTAGFLASQGYLNIAALMAVTFAGAVLGDSVGYSFGKKVGPKIFKRDDSLLFNKAHLLRAKAFYERYGGTAIILARFIPVIRTFAPILAGVGEMRYPVFLFYNVVGGTFWAVGLTALGYWLGRLIPDIDKYLLPIIFLIILISFIPPLAHFLRSKEDRERLRRLFGKLMGGKGAGLI